MADALFRAICRTGVFMICAQAIVHFRPKEAYEKYLKLIVSVMILLQLFQPFGGLFTGGEGADGRPGSMVQGLKKELEEAGEQAKEADRLLEEMTLEEVRRRMQEEQMRENLTEGLEEEQTQNSENKEGGQTVREVESVQIEVSAGGAHEKQHK